MIRFGRIRHINTLDETGYINGFDERVYEFPLYELRDDLQKGDLCAFRPEPPYGKRIVPHFVQRAYVSKDKRLIIDRRHSHLHAGITSELVTKICAQITCGKEKTIKQQVDFDEIIGTTNCVSITPDDEIVYAVRLGRFGHSKFVKHRAPIPTQSATIVIAKANHHYKILTAYLGTASEPEPKDRKAGIASIQFWSKHALVFGSEPIHTSSITAVCPWKSRKPA